MTQGRLMFENEFAPRIRRELAGAESQSIEELSILTLDDIASYCEFLGCKVSLGHPDYGFVHLDGSGLEDRSYTYNRINMLHEASALPSPREVLEHADTFRITRVGETRTLTRDEFESELTRFKEKAGVA